MSLLADNTLASVGNSFYLTKNEPDAGDITVNSITVEGVGVNPSVDVSGHSKFSNGFNNTVRVILGPAPSSTNLDYCSMITATNTFATNYSSNLGFWTHGNASTAGDPTLRMTIDSSGNVSVLGSGNLTVGGNVSSANIPALPMLPSQTALVATQQVPINISAGINTTNIGAPITVPKSGLYILTGAFNYDGTAGQGITFGSADFLAIRLDIGAQPPPAAPHGTNVSLDNYLGDNDRSTISTIVVPLLAGVTYQPQAICYNISGTSVITGSPNYYGAYALTALC